MAMRVNSNNVMDANLVWRSIMELRICQFVWERDFSAGISLVLRTRADFISRLGAVPRPLPPKKRGDKSNFYKFC